MVQIQYFPIFSGTVKVRIDPCTIYFAAHHFLNADSNIMAYIYVYHTLYDNFLQGHAQSIYLSEERV